MQTLLLSHVKRVPENLLGREAWGREPPLALCPRTPCWLADISSIDQSLWRAISPVLAGLIHVWLRRTWHIGDHVEYAFFSRQRNVYIFMLYPLKKIYNGSDSSVRESYASRKIRHQVALYRKVDSLFASYDVRTMGGSYDSPTGGSLTFSQALTRPAN